MTLSYLQFLVLVPVVAPGPSAARALYQLAVSQQQVALYSQAADLSERFATTYPNEKAAPIALGHAYDLRMGLGEPDKALADGQLLVKLSRSSRPEAAAGVVLHMSEIYEQQHQTNQLIRHLQDYLKTWGAKGGVDRQVVAHFKLGQALWQRSCPQEAVHGACVSIEQPYQARKRQRIKQEIQRLRRAHVGLRKINDDGLLVQCGPPQSIAITLVERRQRLAREAQDHFKAALRLHADAKALCPCGADQEGRSKAAVFAAAGSAFYQAEQTYERFLRVGFPKGLHFQPPGRFDSPRLSVERTRWSAESLRRHMAYSAEKTGLAEKLTNANRQGLYDLVLGYDVDAWTVAALARIAQVPAGFVSQLYTADIPSDLREQDEWGSSPREFFCDVVLDKADAMETTAAQAYLQCLEAGARTSSSTEWPGLCEAELSRIDPVKYPVPAELVPEATFVAVPDVAPAVETECIACEPGGP